VSLTASNEDFRIRLDQVFNGPMDLLLHLVREQEVEIHEVEIARVVDGYLAWLGQMEELDIELAGEFLVMASTLMAIKSHSLFPHESLDLEDELDPQDELVQRLLEYRRFKDASEDLRSRLVERARLFSRGWHGDFSGEDPGRSLDLGEVTTWDLLAIWSRLVRETLANRPQEIISDSRPLRFYVDEIVRILEPKGHLDLGDLIESVRDTPRREATIGSFCAVLELVRMQLVDVRQEAAGGDIAIAIRPEHRGSFSDAVEASEILALDKMLEANNQPEGISAD